MLNNDIFKKLIQKLVDELPGDWLVIGGTVPYLVGINSRPTIDIDLAPMQMTTNVEALKLMEISENLGLPIETINQAGSFFLNKISNWQSQTILFRAGKKGRIFRPNLELFLTLKMGRLSEGDLTDCLAYIDWCRKNKELGDLARVRKNLYSTLKSNKDPMRKKRLEDLITILDKL